MLANGIYNENINKVLYQNVLRARQTLEEIYLKVFISRFFDVDVRIISQLFTS